VNDRQFNLIAKALSDPQRFALLRKVSQVDELGCKALVSAFAVTQATISHHMKELTTAGLVEGRKEGQCMYFTARADVLAHYLREVEKRLAPRGGRAPARGIR
jgi:ArsR family transcriptional regulator